MLTSPAAEEPREAVLDALAAILCLDRGDESGASAMANSYARAGQVSDFLSAIAAVALCAVRYSAMVSGQSPEHLLAGVIAQVRNQESVQ